MKIITIEDKAFESIKERFEAFTKQIKQWRGADQHHSEWLDNQDVYSL